MVAPLAGLFGGDERVLVGPETADDAGVFLHGGEALIATVDFITPVCDDPYRFGRVAAANSLSDVYAMGGSPLFALNVCCFPEKVPDGILAAILEGAASVLQDSGAAMLGGHTVQDDDLKFGLAVVGRGDRDRLLTNAGAREGDHLILTKPLGTGVLINAFRANKLDAAGLEPALREMERLNASASEAALAHGARAATDVTGFGLVGHAMEIARASGVGIRIEHARLPCHERFFPLVDRGVSTGSTSANKKNAEGCYEESATLSKAQRDLVFDPQTSGGLLVALRPDKSPALLDDLGRTGHRAARIGEVVAGPARVRID